MHLYAKYDPIINDSIKKKTNIPSIKPNDMILCMFNCIKILYVMYYTVPSSIILS